MKLQQCGGGRATHQDEHGDLLCLLCSLPITAPITDWEGGGTQTKSMVNYSPPLAAIHYTAFIIHHMASDMPRKPEQLLESERLPAIHHTRTRIGTDTSEAASAHAGPHADKDTHTCEQHTHTHTHTCKQHTDRYKWCVAAASSTTAVTQVKTREHGEDTYRRVTIVTPPSPSQTRSLQQAPWHPQTLDYCLGFLSSQAIYHAMVRAIPEGGSMSFVGVAALWVTMLVCQSIALVQAEMSSAT